jgi:hypothetical protein
MMVDRVRTVVFQATGEPATGPLTWAQQHILAIAEDLHPHTQSMNIRFDCELRAGVEEDDVVDGVRDLLQSFDALRTRYVPAPQGPAQHVSCSGELALRIVEAGGEPGADVAGRVRQSMADIAFDTAQEWPARVAMVTDGGTPRHLVFVLSHLMVDFGSSRWIVYHLRHLVHPPPAPERLHVSGYRPLADARWQQSDAGQHSAHRALLQHTATLRRMPQTMLPRYADPADTPRYRYVQLESPALGVLVPALASRKAVTSTAVLAAAICAVSSFVSGLDRAFLQLTLANRISAEARSGVGMFVQDVPVFLDLSVGCVDELIVQAGRTVINAARFGRFPPAQYARHRRDAELQRGVALDLSCWLNNRYTDTQPAGAELPARTTMEPLVSASVARVLGGDAASTSTFFIYADGTDGGLTLTMLIDTTVLPTGEGVLWLRSVERLLCAAAYDDVALVSIGRHTDLVPDSRTDDWCRVDAGWAHIPAVAELVGQCAHGARVDVFPVRSERAVELVAYVDTGGRHIELETLHQDCVAALPGRRTAVAPDRYLLCAGAPSTQDRARWLAMPVLAEGSGRPETPA